MDHADISGNGDSPWVTVSRGGGTVVVDCLDPNTGESMSWGGATATLLYSPDGKMRATVSDDSGDVTGTDGFARIMPNYGYVGINIANYSAGMFRIAVVD